MAQSICYDGVRSKYESFNIPIMFRLIGDNKKPEQDSNMEANNETNKETGESLHAEHFQVEMRVRRVRLLKWAGFRKGKLP